jgi:hypothetical protein
MEMQSAQFLLYLITTIAAVVWVVGIYFLAQSARIGRNSPGDLYQFDQSAMENTILGSMEVAGDSAELSAAAVAQFARNQTSGLGTLRILEVADNQVTFQGGGNEQPGGFSSRRIQKGKLIFSAAAVGRTRIDYAILIDKSLRILLVIGGIVSLAGLIAIFAGFALISIYIIPDATPGVRWQTLQMLQVIHFLWPPFLFGGIYRSQFSSVKNAFETFLHNLPYAK